jgi:hypothetical protein
MSEIENLETLSGYSNTRDLLATRYNATKSRSKFVIALPLHLIPSHLPKPNPEEPFEGNRRVDLSHARKFARYWRENEDWTTPPILLDTNAGMKFEPKFRAAGVEVGVLALPHNTAGSLDILDGQHRVLGWYLALDEITTDLKHARQELQVAKQGGSDLEISVCADKVDRLEALEERLRNEYVTMELVAGVTLQQHKQAFADITNNARGITKSKTIEFDSVSVINRVTREIAESHSLLAGRVDFEQDRVTGKNSNLISARNVSDVVRHVALGIKGRMNERREKAFGDDRLETLTTRFLDCLTESFDEYGDLIDGAITPEDLRKTSLLASPTILRVLAGVFHNLAVEQIDDIPHLVPGGYESALKFFTRLAGQMDAPVLPKTPWHETGFFPEEGGMAPSSRAQDLSGLTDRMTKWATGEEPIPF